MPETFGRDWLVRRIDKAPNLMNLNISWEDRNDFSQSFIKLLSNYCGLDTVPGGKEYSSEQNRKGQVVVKSMRPKIGRYGVMEKGDRQIYTTASESDKTNKGKKGREKEKKPSSGLILEGTCRSFCGSNVIKDLE